MIAAAFHKFQRLYALSGNRIVLRSTAPLASPPFCGMRKTSEVNNLEQYYQLTGRILYMKPRSFEIFMVRTDHLFGILVSTSDCHPRGPGFDSRLYPRIFSGSIGSGTGSTQPREDNWVAT